MAAGSDERTAWLADFDFRRGETFYYECGFRDRWEHEVCIEKVLGAAA